MKVDESDYEGLNDKIMKDILETLERINYLNNTLEGGMYHCIENSRAYMYLVEALYQLRKRRKVGE